MMSPFTGLRRIHNDERGAGIVTALMITLTVFTLGTLWTQIGLHQVEQSSHERFREQALNSAEAGVNAAISMLAGDLQWAGTSGVVSMPDRTGEYEVEVTPVDPNDPNDLDRYIVARGYAPSKTASRFASRQLEQQVLLDPIDGFNYALFASPGGVSVGNKSTIHGDVYSSADLTLNNDVQVTGNVTAVGNIVTRNRDQVRKLWAGKAATLDNTETQILDDVWAGSSGESVALTGTVRGDVQTGGTLTISGDGAVNGTVSENNPPPAPPVYTQPTFTWDPNNYPTATSWTSASNFMSYWNDNKDAFTSHHRIAGGDSSSQKTTLDKPWFMASDVTIVSDAQIRLSRQIENITDADGDGNDDNVVLTIVSFSDREPAIQLTNDLVMESSVKVLLFAPNGTIDFQQLKSFRGVVYGETISTAQDFTLTFDPPAVPGFGWDATSPVHFDVRVQTFREVPFDPPA